MGGLVLSLFDLTGNFVKPWAEAGFKTLCVDTQHRIRAPLPGTLNVDLSTIGPLLVALQQRGYGPKDIAFLACWPVCTDVAVSGARDFRTKGLRRLAASVEQFATCQELAELVECPYMIENPVSAMATHWRKPDHYFHPHHFAGFEPADNYTKLTCIWSGNGFVMPEAFPLLDAAEPDDRIHNPPRVGSREFSVGNPDGVCPCRLPRECVARERRSMSSAPRFFNSPQPPAKATVKLVTPDDVEPC
ncbi:MAG: hypothetical protein EA385_15200 [Salinarimonadaceae bacterium]|nr:MAG: hypothetical protein EA385_15200 [Salinarimonadaceae bacterium]